MADLIVGQEAALDNVVFLAPVEERFGADGGVVKRQGRLAFFSAADQKAVHVPLAETGERNIFLGRPANKAAELDFIVTLGFLRAGGLEMEVELVECLFPGKRGGSG